MKLVLDQCGSVRLKRARWRAGILAVLVLSSSLGLRGVASVQDYLPPGAVDVAAVLPPPPSDDSPAGQADLETVLQVQADRTPAEVARAERVAHHSAFTMGATVFGPWFTRENLPRTAKILERVQQERGPLVAAAKQRWNRKRPYLRDARVHPCIEPLSDGSYPSGHSVSAAVWAAIFSAAFPERAKEFELHVQETMWARVLAGVHYPSDTTAGRQLGEEIGRQMLRTEAMREAIVEMRNEVAAVAKSKTTKP